MYACVRVCAYHAGVRVARMYAYVFRRVCVCVRVCVRDCACACVRLRIPSLRDYVRVIAYACVGVGVYTRA